MRSEKLYDALTKVDADLVNEAGTPPKKQRKNTFLRPRWIGAIAAMLALVILATLVLRPGSESFTACALEKPIYPATAPYPDYSLFSESGKLDEAAYEAAVAAEYKDWQNRKNARANYSSEMLEDYLGAAIPAFLEGHDGENVACSPLNLYLSLAMLAEITDGATRDQILSLLGVENVESLRKLASSLFLANYINDGVQKSLLASAIWLRNDMDYDAETLKRLATVYYAASFRGEMGSKDYDKLLQDWLNEQTDSLLADQVGSLSFDPQTVLALTTTVDFAGKWFDAFSPERTVDGTFHAVNGDESCRLMRQSEGSTYYWGEQFGAVDLLLTNGGRMRFVLPDEGVSPEALLRDPEAIRFLLTVGYNAWENSKDLTVHLSLPQFDVSSQLDLEQTLKDLGVQDVFDANRADFSPLTNTDGTCLSDVKHGARVAVDEEGVTAAAFTIMLAAAGIPPEEEIEFTLDRPFLFVIYGEDELPLFVGIVNHPTASGAAEGVKRSLGSAETQTPTEPDPQAEAEAQERKLEASDISNLRSAYAEAMSNWLAGDGDTSQKYEILQKEAGWITENQKAPNGLDDIAAELSQYTGGSFSITVTASENGDPTATLNYFK